MSGIAIFAETPRAGDLGHRFLADACHSISESQIVGFLHAAKSDLAFGGNFVAVGHTVPQQTGSGARRQGHEAIVLAGIDVARMSGYALAQIVEMLRGYLENLASLVMDKIEWSTVRHSEVVVRRPELTDWLAGLQTLSVPVTEWHKGPQPLREQSQTSPLTMSRSPTKVRGVRWPLAVLAVGVSGLGAGFAAGAMYFHEPPSPAIPTAIAKPFEPPDVTRPDLGNIEIPTRPFRDEPAVSVDAGALIVDAVTAGDSSLKKVLAILPRNISIPDRARNVAIDQCEALLQSEQFDDALNLTSALTARSHAFDSDPEQIARLADLKRTAQEGCASLDQKDRRLYENVLRSSEKRRAEAARDYLNSAPRQFMKQNVEDWLDWTEEPVSIKVTAELPSGGPSVFRLKAANDRVLALPLDIPESGKAPAVTLDLSHLEIDVFKLPCTLVVSLEPKQVVSLLHKEKRRRFEGQLYLQRGTQDDPIPLKSTGSRESSGEVEVRVLTGEMPQLPEWRKD